MTQMEGGVKMFQKIVMALLALLLFSGGACAAGYGEQTENGEIKAYIRELCEEYGVSEYLVFAVIEKESSWNADAVNYNETCFGLMQISVVNFSWLKEELGLDDLKKPYQNVQAGIYMLSGYLEKYLDYHMALMCYNCGEAGARKLWEEGTFTNAYSRWVIDRMHDLEWEALEAARDRLNPQNSESEDETLLGESLHLTYGESFRKTACVRKESIGLNPQECWDDIPFGAEIF